jgi:pilus assembly protein Flp/PilA
MKKLLAFLKDEDGLEMSEYAVIGGLIVIGTVVAVTALSAKITAAFNAITDKIKSE